MKAVRIHTHGGPEVLQFEDIDLGEPAPNQVQVRHTAIGVNFIDIYYRTGLYPTPLPSGLGTEAAGVITALGQDVTGFKIGDRVAYTGGALGSYAEARLMTPDRLVKLPDGVDDLTAASIMLKGMTARYLVRETYRVKAGDTILVHAAAGGVGQLLVQWAKHLGAKIIGTIGSPEKAEIAKAKGCDHVILYRSENFVDRVKAITDGQGVNVVYDSVGKDTFAQSLDCLQKRGLMVSFGQSSGQVPPFDPGLLATKGSLYLTRPNLVGYTATRSQLTDNAAEVFQMLESGVLKIEPPRQFPLLSAAEAHKALEGRHTSGASVLMP